MQTIYDKTSSSVPQTGTLIDLTELRCQRALAQQDCLARQFETDGQPQAHEEEPAFQPVVLTTTPAQRRQARWERCAWNLDVCASLSVILVTLLFALWVIV